MNFRTRKDLIKRPNRSSSSSRILSSRIQEDFTTQLPVEVLTQILSLLPDADANRMRILSHTWNDKDLWALLPNLHFVIPFCQSEIQENKFQDRVDQTLVRRGKLPIQKFFLDCSKKCDYERVYNWLRSIVKCKVQELDLRFPGDRYKVRFCWDLFKTCDTLVVLTLKGEFSLDVPEAELLFPCLKKVNLISIVYSDNQSLTNLISGCPALEELFVDRQVSDDKLETFKVSSQTLKTLRMSFTHHRVGWRYTSVIDAPNLEYLHIVDQMSTICSFTKPKSLVEAHIDTFRFDAQLFSHLSSSKILTLTLSSIGCLQAISIFHGLNVPVFHNLIMLETCVNSRSHWNLLLTLLNNMPNLEHITLLDGLLHEDEIYKVDWNPPVEVPACLSFKMKEIILLNKEAIRHKEFIFIRFLLENSNILKTFRVNAHDIHPRRREELLNFHRGSNLYSPFSSDPNGDSGGASIRFDQNNIIQTKSQVLNILCRDCANQVCGGFYGQFFGVISSKGPSIYTPHHLRQN